MELWVFLCASLWTMRGGFSRTTTFSWFMIVVAGFCIRTDNFGVTSFIRGLGLHEKYYDRLLDFFHSPAVKLPALTQCWTRFVFKTLPVHTVNGHSVLISDGFKAPKEGKKMPAVKSLHQESASNSKPEYIMGHSWQVIAALITVGTYSTAVPLNGGIGEGVVYSNRSKKTLLDKLLDLLSALGLPEEQRCYLVCDAYYATGKMANGLLASGHHIISRVKKNAVAYKKCPQRSKNKRGRTKIYGEKIKLASYFSKSQSALFISETVSIYNDTNASVQYYSEDLLWRPTGFSVRFVWVKHPTRGNIILMSTDLTLNPVDIIELYALRFKIEVHFKSAVHTIGAYFYHFWSMVMKPIKRGSGNQHLHKLPANERENIKRKLHAYHVFLQTGMIAHGLLICLAVLHPNTVWKYFGSWLRTIRPDVLPSELVVMSALRNLFPQFLMTKTNDAILQKLILDRADPSRIPAFKLAS